MTDQRSPEIQRRLYGLLALMKAADDRARFVPNPAAPNLEAQVYPSPGRIAAAAQRTLQGANVHG